MIVRIVQGLIVPRSIGKKRREVAEYAGSHGIPAACDHFGLSYSAVYSACRVCSIDPPGHSRHSKSRNLRKSLSEYAKNHTAAETSEKFGVSRSYVHKSCCEFSVVPKKATRVTSVTNAFKVISMLIKGHSQADIAQAVGLTRSYVNSLMSTAVEVGLIDITDIDRQEIK